MSENRLGREKSPYLLQHKDNPVHWWAWGQEAFEAAKRENKPIFLSVGYSTCYWCHVMEKDSFEREDVAAALNRSFISIKVDREERPDVDKIYMNAVTAISGHGGWPMSVFLTAEGKPFFGATFFYREQFLKLLASIDESWRTRRADLESASDRIIDHLREVTQSRPSDGKTPTAEIFTEAKKLLDGAFDEKNGGFGPAPKFPHPGAISLLFRIAHRNDDSDAENIAVTTLDRMARGGIYDHLGGGFARYATDAAWRVPHFEKMLYDNAQLAIAYLEGLQFTGRPMFGQVTRETLDYLLREMTAPAGGFYSAQDAGEVGKEGEFYIWTANEIDSNLPADERLQFKQLFNITPQGNFEKGTSILSISPEADWERRTRPPIEQARRKLFQLRTEREAPHKDDKVLVSWNGLAISAFARASQVLDEPRYLEAATDAARLIEQKLLIEGKLLRRFRDEAGIEGMLDDYAFLIQGLIDLYQSNFDSHWLDLAQKLQKRQDELFWREPENGYAYTSGADKTLLSQPVSFSDGAEPSPNGISALNLLKLYKLTNDRAMEKRALTIISQALNSRRVHPLEFSTILQALDFQLGPTPEIAVIGTDEQPATDWIRAAATRFIPNKVVAAGKPAGFDDPSVPALLRGKQLRDGKTTYYICQNHTCREPVTDLNKALEMISLESAPKARTAAPE